MKAWYEAKTLTKKQIIKNSKLELAVFAIFALIGVGWGWLGFIELEVACFFCALLYWDLFHRSKDSFNKAR